MSSDHPHLYPIYISNNFWSGRMTTCYVDVSSEEEAREVEKKLNAALRHSSNYRIAVANAKRFVEDSEKEEDGAV